MKKIVAKQSKKIPSDKGQLWLSFPSMTWMTLFFLLPTAMIFAFAFKSSDFYGNLVEGWTLENWRKLLSTSYLGIIWRTVSLSCVATLLCLVLALPVGYSLARSTSKVKQQLLMLVVIPSWSSFLVRIFAWKAFLHPEGMFKRVLVDLHIVSPHTSLLYNDGAILLVMVYTYLPFAILPIYAAAAKFDFNLIEAALDLGTTRWQAFYKVFIPTIRKGIATATVMVLIPALGAYIIPDLVGGTQSQMIGNKIAQKVFVERNLPQAAVLSAFMALLVFLPLLLVTLLQRQRRTAQHAKGG